VFTALAVVPQAILYLQRTDGLADEFASSASAVSQARSNAFLSAASRVEYNAESNPECLALALNRLIAA
jgi:hypothetical protein